MEDLKAIQESKEQRMGDCALLPNSEEVKEILGKIELFSEKMVALKASFVREEALEEVNEVTDIL